MKLSSIITVLTLAVWNSPAVLAQEWDLTPVQLTAIESNSAPMTIPQPQLTATQEQILQWDLDELHRHHHERGNTTNLTGAGYYAPSSNPTGTQSLPSLPPCTTAQFGYVAGGKGGLPSTSLDSFVQNAGGNAETIYGDEGSDSIPPLFNFDTINSGIQGQSAAGLTTGHRSSLPSAWN